MTKFNEKAVREALEGDDFEDAFLDFVLCFEEPTKEDLIEAFKRAVERWENDYYNN